jgi:hypothetical protein
MITNFTILGERCSGTNYLEELFLLNFDLDLTWEYGWKHFFGFNNYENSDQTLFIGIVRHPIYWIDSFYKSQHHIPNKPKPFFQFANDIFYSVDDNNEIITDDLNYTNKQKYKNIFESRFCKNYYLLNIMPQKVKNYILIRYEDLRDNYESILNKIKIQFNLSPKNDVFQNVHYYKKDNEKEYKKKKLSLSLEQQMYCHKKLNIEQEKRLGYLL